MRSEVEKAEGEAFADYCRNAKPPITGDDPARCATAVASFSAGWKAGYAFDEMPDDLKQIQDLLAHAFIGKATTVIGKGLVERWNATIAAQAEAIRLLREALAPVDAAAAYKARFWEGDWNPLYHLEVTLTVAECRAIRNALAATAPKEQSE